MDVSSDMLSLMSLAFGAAWASGLNLYATVLILGGLNAFGVVTLPPDMAVISTPEVLITAGVLYFLEFFANKIPGIDTLNDTLHTFIRIPAGAMLAYSTVSDTGEPWQAAAALLLGGLVTAGTHATKTGTRAIINMSPEPFSNWAASIFEDMLVLIGLLLALFKPAIFLIWLAAFAVFLIWSLPKIWRGLKMLWARIQEMRGNGSAPGTGLALTFTGPPDTPSSRTDIRKPIRKP